MAALAAFTVKHPIAVLLGHFLDLHPPVADHYPRLFALTAAGAGGLPLIHEWKHLLFPFFLNKVIPKSLQAQ